MAAVKTIWKILVGVKDGLVLLLMLLFFGLLFASLSLRPTPTAITAGALDVDLNGTLVEQLSEARPLALVSGGSPMPRQVRLRDLVRALNKAASDARVKAVVLDLAGFHGGGEAALSEVGAALDRVRRAGKPVLAWSDTYDDSGYLLAAHASEVWLDPLGMVSAAGPGGSQLYFKALLDRIGANFHIYRVGTYKSAVEPFIRMDQSPAAKQADQALIDALWGGWKVNVHLARPQAEIDRYLADPVGMLRAAGADAGRAAMESRLVDHVAPRAAFDARVAGLVGAGDATKDKPFKTIALDDWIAANPAPTGGAAIGVVTVAGDILDSGNTPGAAIGEDIARRIREAVAKGNLKALVVRVDSPGGSVSGSEKIREAILGAKAKGLPVVVSMGSVAASGGYWLSTAGDRIFAEPSTITGSIGVFAIIPTFEHTLAKVGIGVDGVRATPFSGEPDPLAGTTPQVDQLIQFGVDNIYGRFTHLVAAARHLTPARVDEIGQGRVWAGGIARQIGLVDQFGTADDAIAAAARMAKLDPAHVHPVYIEKSPGLLTQLLSGLGSAGDEGSAAAAGWTGIASRPDMILANAVGQARMILAGPTMQVRCIPCGAAEPPSPADRGAANRIMGLLGL